MRLIDADAIQYVTAVTPDGRKVQYVTKGYIDSLEPLAKYEMVPYEDSKACCEYTFQVDSNRQLNPYWNPTWWSPIRYHYGDAHLNSITLALPIRSR